MNRRDALDAGHDLAHAVAALLQHETGPETRILPAARKALLDLAGAVLDEPELVEVPVDFEEAAPRKGSPEEQKRRRNATRRPEEWGEKE